MVKVAPLARKTDRPSGRLGFMRGEIKVPEDFDTMSAEEIQAMFGGKD